MKNFLKNLTFLLFIFIMATLLYKDIWFPQGRVVPISYSEFLNSVERGTIRTVIIVGNEIHGKMLDKGFRTVEYETYAPYHPELVEYLRKKGVVIIARPQPKTPWWVNLFINWFPTILLIVFWVWMLQKMSGGGAKALSFGKSNAKLVENKAVVTFEDVAGCDEAKEELKEIIDFLKNPKKFTSLGAKIPRGVLMVGPPGTGKTLLARAVSGEADVPFFYISGSDFVEMFVGVGASRVRDLFEQARKNAPCIVFIDEIDAVGRHRGAGLGGGHDEREQTLNALLVEMDGFDNTKGVIIMAATNRPDVLDPALLRPGRFDRQVVVTLPDLVGREGILKVHTKKIPLAEDVDLKVIARGTPYFSGADLANLVNEAALLAARRDKPYVEMQEFEEARDKVMMGPERKNRVRSEKETKITAYHEAGHALLAMLLPLLDPLYKVTIIPRGMAGGLTQLLPEEEKFYHSKEMLLQQVTMMLGGRVAEELIFNEITTGAGNDLKRATELCRRMVCEWGMSEKLGPLTFGSREEHIFLGREITRSKDYSENTAVEIDKEVHRIMMECYEKARALLQDNIEHLKVISENLVDREVLTREEIEKLMKGEKLDTLWEETSEKDSGKSEDKKIENYPQPQPEH